MKEIIHWVLEINVYGDESVIEMIEQDIEAVWEKYCTCSEGECRSPISGVARYPDPSVEDDYVQT